MATTTTTSESSEGPVLSLMTKRLRNLRKRHKKILQLEDEISQGKTLNKDQEETLRSKPSVLTLIDEYEKLRQPLSAALQEELTQSGAAAAASSDEPSSESSSSSSEIEEILKLVYFGSLFDVKEQSEFTSTMVTRTHERECCLTYDYVTDEAVDLLGEKDLDMISVLNSLVVSRPANSCISHKNAVKSCVEHAKLWLSNSDQPIEQGSNVTYVALKERLNKILASDYYTTSPEMKAANEVAAAAGKYAPSHHVPVQGSSVSSEMTVQTESDYAEQKDEETEQTETQETGAEHSSPVEEHPKEVEISNVTNDSSIQEDKNPEIEGEEQNYKDEESRDQQQNSRRGYQNYRGNRGGGGGRRGGFPNGRGGRGGRGGYQNGRGQGQYYDQPGNSYPRNYYNSRGRGGGGRGAYNNGGGSARGGYAQAEEVRS